MIKEIKIRLDVRFGPNRWGENKKFGPGVAGNFLRKLRVKVGFNQDDPYFFLSHLRSQTLNVRWSRRNSGTEFDKPRNLKPKMFGEVGPRIVIGDNSNIVESRKGLLPFGIS